MGGVTHYSITFPPQQRPCVTDVVQQVESLSGLGVYYDAEKLTLICLAIKRHIHLYEGDENEYLITMGTLQADYLLVTTIWILQQFGGSCPGSLPTWAGQSWSHLNKWTYRLKRHYIYYPADARQ
jgi:hypothetical protein